jgi:hypothetical protein
VTGLDTLLLTGGIVAALGGAAKFRPGIRNRMGTSPAALLELGVGALAALLGVTGAGAPALRWAVLAAALLALVLSALHQSSINRAWRADRAASEEARLRVFLRTRGVVPQPLPDAGTSTHPPLPTSAPRPPNGEVAP